MMEIIKAENITVNFPLYGTRSFKNKMINNLTGGKIKMVEKTTFIRAIDGMSFIFNEGDRVGLYGHNGSGKTTLLRVLAGIYKPDSGKLDVNGSVTSLLNIAVGMEGEATGIENIFMRSALLGIRKKDIEPMVSDIIEFSDLGEYINLPIRTYSSGMDMRLKFAIATSVQSDIILMDEWLSVGDSDFTIKAVERLNSLINKAKVLIVASHNIKFLEDTCNRIINIEHGQIMNEYRPNR